MAMSKTTHNNMFELEHNKRLEIQG